MAKNKVLNEGALEASTRSIINNNFADISLCSTQLDAVTGTTGTTLTNVSAMITDSLDPGTYEVYVHWSGVSTANSGVKLGLKWGTASMITATEIAATGRTASASATQHTTTSTDQTSLFAQTAAVIEVDIRGIVVIGTAGTLQFQMAQNAAHADTTSTYVKSYMRVTKIASN